MLKTSHKGVLTEFSDKVSKFSQVICGRDPTQTLVSCPCLGGAYHRTFKLSEYATFHLVAVI